MNWQRALFFFPVNWSYGRWLYCYFTAGVKIDEAVRNCDAEGYECLLCKRGFWREGRRFAH